MATRIALLLATHIFAGIVGLGAILLLMSGNHALLSSVIERLIDSPGALQRTREEAAGRVDFWCVIALVFSFLFALAWLFLTERITPVDAGQARSQRSSWAIFFVLIVVAFGIAGFVEIAASGVSGVLNGQSVAVSGLIILLLTCAAYYLGTRIAVKQTMRPSVPVAG